MARFLRGRARAVPDDGRMSLAEHIAELRRRLVWAFAAILVASIVAFIFYKPIFRFMTHPYCGLDVSHRAVGGESCQLIVTGVFDALAIQIKVSAIAGVFLASPVWVYQIWAFVAPGLHRHEKKWALIFAACSTVLFAAGAAFAYLTLPKGLQFLLSFAGNLTVLLGIQQYFSFLIAMLLIFGASFEFPLLIVLLNAAGLVSGRTLANHWRSIIFGIFAFAAIATPSQDPYSMSAMALPMTLLYGVALLIARANDRRRARREASSEYTGISDDEASPLDLGGTPAS